MDNIQRITLDIRDNQTYEQIYTKQYNKGFHIEFEITKDGEPFDLSGCTASFEMKKPDKTVIWCNCSIMDNILSVEVNEQMTAANGKAEFQITLMQGTVLITTVTGIMKIDKSVIQDGDIESSDQFSIIIDILDEIENVKQIATNIEDDLIEAKTYVDEAKTSAENALTSEFNAKQSEENAGNSEIKAKTSEENTLASELNAKQSEINASTYSTNAEISATTATEQATLAMNYATNTQEILNTSTGILAKKADLDDTGKVKIDQIPKVALDNLVKVENDTARFALTTETVQRGDTVKVLESDDGSGERMYLVIDDTKLDSEDGYTGYSATTTWETIEGKPDNIAYITSITTDEYNDLSELDKNNGIIYYVTDGIYIAHNGIIYGKSDKFYCTQAEYDALPDTKSSDNIIYMITDAESGSDYYLNQDDIVDDLTTESATKPLSANQGAVLNDKIEEATNIAKGRNRAHVFSTTADMQAWLSDENNKGLYNVGDNIYIVDVDVPDWWVSEVLEEVDESTGYYYNIAQLETQKVDLTEIESDITNLQSNLGGLKFELKTIEKTRVSDTYPSVIQLAVANAINKSIFVTPGTANTAYIPYVRNIQKFENAINIVFAENLEADTTYYLDLLIIG